MMCEIQSRAMLVRSKEDSLSVCNKELPEWRVELFLRVLYGNIGRETL